MARTTQARRDRAVSSALIPLILASGSAARAATLRAAGLAFKVVPAEIDEDAVKREGLAPRDIALKLAEQKALRVSERHPGALVIGADQVLICDGRRFDKPGNRAAAREQLLALRGRTHVLMTAVVCARDGAIVWRHIAAPALTMRAFSDAALDEYLAAEGDAVLGCVGAYRLEGRGAQLFERFEGGYFAVLGVPLLPLLGFLRECGAIRN